MSNTAEEMVAQFAELKQMADDGNEVAGRVIAWFDQVSGHADLTGTYPNLPLEGIALTEDIAHTVKLFWGARLLRWLIDHPGSDPTHFTLAVDVGFEDIGGTNA